MALNKGMQPLGHVNEPAGASRDKQEPDMEEKDEKKNVYQEEKDAIAEVFLCRTNLREAREIWGLKRRAVREFNNEVNESSLPD